MAFPLTYPSSDKLQTTSCAVNTRFIKLNGSESCVFSHLCSCHCCACFLGCHDEGAGTFGLCRNHQLGASCVPHPQILGAGRQTRACSGCHGRENWSAQQRASFCSPGVCPQTCGKEQLLHRLLKGEKLPIDHNLTIVNSILNRRR